MIIAGVILLFLALLDESGFFFTVALVLGLLFGGAYMAGLGWHMAM